jgi:HSP20 family protein
MQWDQVRELLALQHRLERLRSPSAPEWTPPVDLYETSDRYVVLMELAGLSRDDVAIEAQEDRVTLSGARPARTTPPDRFHQVERGHGAFSRTFAFAHPIDVDRITAEFRDGVLTVTIPKKHRPQPRRIEVE